MSGESLYFPDIYVRMRYPYRGDAIFVRLNVKILTIITFIAVQMRHFALPDAAYDTLRKKALL